MNWVQVVQDRIEQWPAVNIDKPSDSTKDRKFLGQLSKYWLLKDYAPWNYYDCV
jgi:hypothetical protein